MSLGSRMTALAVLASVLTASGASAKNDWNWFFPEAHDADQGHVVTHTVDEVASFEEVVLTTGRFNIPSFHGMVGGDDSDPPYTADHLARISRDPSRRIADRLLLGAAEPVAIDLGFTARTGPHSIYVDGNWVQQGNRVTADSPLLTSPVPESQTYALMLAGLAMVGMVLRRRRS